VRVSRSLFEVLTWQGHQLDQWITFLFDGGEMVRDPQLILNPHAEHSWDWSHATLQAGCLPAMGHRSAMIVDQTLSPMVWYRWQV
jgi:hypothetical protein